MPGTGYLILLLVAPMMAGLSGDQYAFLRAVDPRAHTLTFDQLQWFWGAAAHRACVQDGEKIYDLEWCNDYYYRNPSPHLRTIPMAAGAVLTSVTPRQRLTPTQLAGLVAKDQDLYWVIRIRDGVAVSVRQQFVP